MEVAKPRKKVRVGEAGPSRVRGATQEMATPRKTRATTEGRGAIGGEEGLVDVLRGMAKTLEKLTAMTGSIAWVAEEWAEERAREGSQRWEREVVIAPRREQGVGTTDGDEAEKGTDGAEVEDGMDEAE